MALQRIIIPSIALVMFLVALPVRGQMINSPCTSSMLTSFTPCMNYITNSSFNGSSPTSDCCNVLKSVVSNGSGCLCMIATGGVPFNVPFNIPINRTLALSLPRACNMPGVPLQCKASAAPIPAPAPAPGRLVSSPAESPAAAAADAPPPIASSVPSGGSTTSLAPEAAATTPVLAPPTPTTNSGSPPSGNSGNRQSVTPSAAASTTSFSPLLILALIGAIALKNY